MAERKPKDKNLKAYELLEYFGTIARGADVSIAGDMILHNIAEKCPAHYMEDMDAYLCGKLITIIEECLDALQSVPDDRATPYPVKAALSRLGQFIADIQDPKLKELEKLLNEDANR